MSENKWREKLLPSWPQLIISIIIALVAAIGTGAFVVYQVTVIQSSQFQAERIRRVDRTAQLTTQILSDEGKMLQASISRDIEFAFCERDPYYYSDEYWKKYNNEYQQAYSSYKVLASELHGLCITNSVYFGSNVAQASYDLIQCLVRDPSFEVNIDELNSELDSAPLVSKKQSQQKDELFRKCHEKLYDSSLSDSCYSLLNTMSKDINQRKFVSIFYKLE